MQDFFSFINYICCKYIFFSPKWRKQHNVLRYIFLYTLFLLCYSSVVDLTFDTAHVDSFLNVHVTTVTPACTPLHTKSQSYTYACQCYGNGAWCNCYTWLRKIQ